MSIEQSFPLMDQLVLVVESVEEKMTMASDSCSFPPWIVDVEPQQKMATASSISAWIDAASASDAVVEHCTGLVLGQEEVVILWHFPVPVLRWPLPPGSWLGVEGTTFETLQPMLYCTNCFQERFGCSFS